MIKRIHITGGKRGSLTIEYDPTAEGYHDLVSQLTALGASKIKHHSKLPAFWQPRQKRWKTPEPPEVGSWQAITITKFDVLDKLIKIPALNDHLKLSSSSMTNRIALVHNSEHQFSLCRVDAVINHVKLYGTTHQNVNSFIVYRQANSWSEITSPELCVKFASHFFSDDKIGQNKVFKWFDDYARLAIYAAEFNSLLT